MEKSFGRLAVIGLAAAMSLGQGSVAHAKEKTLTVLRMIDSDNYDPQRSVAGAAIEVLYMLSDTLVTLDFDMKTIKPGLAKSWTVSDDGLTYTFDLQDGVTFCDGKKFTAADVVYTINRIIDPATKAPFKWRAGDVKAVRADGDHRVVYELNHPFSELLYQLTQSFSLIVDQKNVEALGKDFGVKGMNGTGPFCWENWEPRNQFVMRKHPGYRWGPAFYQNRGPAHVDKLVWKVLPQANTLFATMASGQGDLTISMPSASVQLVAKAPTLRLEEAPVSLKTVYIGFKTTRPMLEDVEVRRALVQAVDQKEIAKSVYFNTADPLQTYVSPNTVDYQQPDQVLGYDPQAAAARLEKAGWTLKDDGFRYRNGEKLSLFALSFPGQAQQLWEAVQGFWRKIGVDVRVQVYDPTIIWSKLRGSDFDGYYMSFDYFSAGDALGLYFKSNLRPAPNRMDYSDPVTDRLIDAGKAATTAGERAKLFSEAQKRVYDAAVWLPVVNERLLLVSNKRVTGTKPHGIYGRVLYKGLDLDIAAR
ncbi:ABC transporter substrate-binding protein [Stella sp.]|uniref:ABC transporter substrate-binding protein n=1 Tax=Stella sp. TaxID=2912054 RepID=UPI0035B0E459